MQQRNLAFSAGWLSGSWRRFGRRRWWRASVISNSSAIANTSQKPNVNTSAYLKSARSAARFTTVKAGSLP